MALYLVGTDFNKLIQSTPQYRCSRDWRRHGIGKTAVLGVTYYNLRKANSNERRYWGGGGGGDWDSVNATGGGGGGAVFRGPTV